MDWQTISAYENCQAVNDAVWEAFRAYEKATGTTPSQAAYGDAVAAASTATSVAKMYEAAFASYMEYGGYPTRP